MNLSKNTGKWKLESEVHQGYSTKNTKTYVLCQGNGEAIKSKVVLIQTFIIIYDKGERISDVDNDEVTISDQEMTNFLQKDSKDEHNHYKMKKESSKDGVLDNISQKHILKEDMSKTLGSDKLVKILEKVLC